MTDQHSHNDSIVRALTGLQNTVEKRLSSEEKHLEQLEHTAGIIRSHIEMDKEILNLMKSIKNKVILKDEELSRGIEMKINAFRQNGLDLIERVSILNIFLRNLQFSVFNKFLNIVP